MNYLLSRLHQYILIVIIFFSIAGVAQKQGQQRIDSLLAVLPDAKEDTVKIKVLYDLSFTYHTINPDEGIKYGKIALSIAENLQSLKQLAAANLALGVNYLMKGNYAVALDYELKALKLSEETGDEVGISKPLNNIGIIYSKMENYKKALEYYEKALKIYLDNDNKKNAATTLGNMGLAYQGMKNREKAIAFYDRSLKMMQELNDNEGMGRNMMNISIVYQDDHDLVKALDYETRAIKLYQDLGNKSDYALGIGNIAWLYFLIATDTSGLKLPDSLQNKVVLLHKSEELLNQAISINKEMGFKNLLQLNYGNLSELQKYNGNFKNALESYKLSILYNDSIYSAENTEKIKSLESQRTEDLKQKEIEIQKLQLTAAKNERWFYIWGLAMVLALFFVILNRYRITSKQKGIIEKEQERSEALLLNILPAETARELKDKGKSDAKMFDEVTVMFTDFKDFTKLTENLSPSVLVNEIDYCYRAFDTIMTKNNIEKIKTIGDSYMAAGGLPSSNKTHPADVVQAAIEIQNFMTERTRAILSGELEGQIFEIRIGIHTGPVVAGIVGIKKFSYDIWGDTVNTAARMESASAPGKINISGVTYELVKNKFVCEHRGKIEAKNKGEVDMYFVQWSMVSSQ